MKRYRLIDHGAIANLVCEDVAMPEPAPDEVVVAMRAVSLNARDLMMVFGPSPYGPKPGIVPVSDGAGEIVRCGSEVATRKVGDRVVLPFRPGWIEGPYQPAAIATDLGGATDGVLAAHVAVKAEAVVPIPAGMTFESAATLPCAGVTAWNALRQGTALKPGDSVLVLGTGGVSIFAMQIAKALGCRVIATTSSDTKAERLRALGADVVINYVAEPEWDGAVLEATGGLGVDRIVEVGGAGSLPRSMACLAPQGEIALVGLLDNPMDKISPLPLMRTMGVLRGISVGSREHLAALADFAAAHFDPVIDRIFAFDDVHEAFGHLASRQHLGKVVIKV